AVGILDLAPKTTVRWYVGVWPSTSQWHVPEPWSLNVSPGMGTNSQVYRSAYSVSLSTPKASEIASLLGWKAANVHFLVSAARSCSSQVSCAEPTLLGT